MLAVNFSITKRYQMQAASGVGPSMLFSGMSGAFTALIFFVVGGFRIELTWFSVGMAALYSLLIVSYTLIGFRIMDGSKVALYTVFLMAGGMIVPFLWGVLFLEEQITILRLAGLVIILISMIIFHRDGEKIGIRKTLLCCAVFLINGFTSVVSKMHQIQTEAVSPISFIVLFNLFSVLLCTLTMVLNKGTKNTVKLSQEVILLSVGSAIAVGLFNLLQLISAKHVLATVQYPVVTGGTVVFTAVAARAFYKEKITVPMAIALLLCVLGTCMFL